MVQTARISGTGDPTRSPSPFSGNYPIGGQKKETWCFKPNLTQSPSGSSEAYRLSRPSLSSLETKKVGVMLPPTVQKKPTAKLKLPVMASKIYERKRIIDVKEEARKSRYTMKKHTGQFAFLDSSVLQLGPGDSKLDFEQVF